MTLVHMVIVCLVLNSSTGKTEIAWTYEADVTLDNCKKMGALVASNSPKAPIIVECRSGQLTALERNRD